VPDRVAIHFDLHGTANGWGGKWSVFILPVTNIATYLLILFLPLIDPKRMNNDDFTSMFYKIRLVLVFFFCLFSMFIAYIAVHGSTDHTASRWIPIATFLLLSILGNFMINIKPNWFIGIRTPWTLSSDTVWRRTHQVFGRLWFYGGLACAALSFYASDVWTARFITAFVLGSAVFAFAYSFWLYKKEKAQPIDNG
jgi:hypothetical protein